LIEIIIPSSDEILGENCFHECGSLSSVTFESGSRLQGIEREVLHQTGCNGASKKSNLQIR
jgi:hypothetical protein